jgi:amidohydrolase
MKIRQSVLAVEKDIIALRRALHEMAEPSLQEFETARFLRSLLDEKGINHRSCANTGIVVDMGLDKPGKAVLFRADMDALEMPEELDVPYKSKNRGCMHACGHDGHMAMLYFALLETNYRRDELKRPVRFIFQPGEEGLGGAKIMINEGVLNKPEVEEAFGFHLSNRLPSGVFGVRQGAFSAFSDRFDIIITGRGGHAAKPHRCVEPIRIAARLIGDCHEMINRETNAMESNVLTFTVINGGSQFNIIDDHCRLAGTIRSRNATDRDFILQRLQRKFQAYELDYECKIEFSLSEGYPAGINTADAVALLREAVTEFGGAESLTESCLGLGGEDFACFLEKVPGCYFMVGAGGLREEHGKYPPFHSTRFSFDEGALKCGTEIVLRLLEKRAFNL